MKYTLDFDDPEFEKTGLLMLTDVEKFLKNKRFLKAILLFGIGDSLGQATTHFTQEEILQIYGNYLTKHEEKRYKKEKKQMD
ncbi:hypothetical protein KG089_02150 [Carnobacteriaceae bacterium zg-ZUI252]|nr:hypothetical protein [Carnobacteriaceae bacterium zg-ZUI252]MBS4770864.1 hypothetical protein [Carnobacteriaceae bacterium zg-ZUI240]